MLSRISLPGPGTVVGSGRGRSVRSGVVDGLGCSGFAGSALSVSTAVLPMLRPRPQRRLPEPFTLPFTRIGGPATVVGGGRSAGGRAFEVDWAGGRAGETGSFDDGGTQQLHRMCTRQVKRPGEAASSPAPQRSRAASAQPGRARYLLGLLPTDGTLKARQQRSGVGGGTRVLGAWICRSDRGTESHCQRRELPRLLKLRALVAIRRDGLQGGREVGSGPILGWILPRSIEVEVHPDAPWKGSVRLDEAVELLDPKTPRAEESQPDLIGGEVLDHDGAARRAVRTATARVV